MYQVNSVYPNGGEEYENIENKTAADSLAKRNRARGATVDVILNKNAKPEESRINKSSTGGWWVANGITLTSTELKEIEALKKAADGGGDAEEDEDGGDDDDKKKKLSAK